MPKILNHHHDAAEMMQQADNIFTGMQNLPNNSHAVSPELDDAQQMMMVEQKLRQ